MYEYEEPRNAAAAALVKILQLMTDQVNNKDQIFEIFMSGSAAIAPISEVFQAETTGKFRGKFIGKTAAKVLDEALDLIQDEPNVP